MMFLFFRSLKQLAISNKITSRLPHILASFNFFEKLKLVILFYNLVLIDSVSNIVKFIVKLCFKIPLLKCLQCWFKLSDKDF